MALMWINMYDKRSFFNLQDKWTRWRVKLSVDKQETICPVYDIPINVINNALYEKWKHQDERKETSNKTEQFLKMSRDNFNFE